MHQLFFRHNSSDRVRHRARPVFALTLLQPFMALILALRGVESTPNGGGHLIVPFHFAYFESIWCW